MLKSQNIMYKIMYNIMYKIKHKQSFHFNCSAERREFDSSNYLEQWLWSPIKKVKKEKEIYFTSQPNTKFFIQKDTHTHNET